MLNQTRDDRGRYEQDTEDMRNRSVVASIIHEELDNFFKSASDRLNVLTTEDMDEETALAVSQAKKDIRNAVAIRFGNPIASSVISTTRLPSSWNGFYKDNWTVVAQEWKSEHPGEGKSFHWVFTIELRVGEVSARLSAKWQSLDDDIKKNYPINGKNTSRQAFGKNFLLDQPEIHKRNRQKLWNSMKNQVRKQ